MLLHEIDPREKQQDEEENVSNDLHEQDNVKDVYEDEENDREPDHFSEDMD